MQEEGPQQECITSLGDATRFSRAISKLGGGFRRELSSVMRTGNHAQRTILLVAGIYMQSHRHQHGKKLGGRLYKMAFLFDRPACEFRMFDPLAHRNTKVLMQRHEPIGRTRFLEQGALRDNPRFWNERGDAWMASQIYGQFAAPGLVE